MSSSVSYLRLRWIDEGWQKTVCHAYACAVWLHHQHTAEENFLDRCCQKRRRVLCSMQFCSCRCCYWPTSTPAESLLISIIALQAFCFPKCDFWGGLEGHGKKFSRLAIARHIFRPPHKFYYNSTTGHTVSNFPPGWMKRLLHHPCATQRRTP